jgi:hypothetical protein
MRRRFTRRVVLFGGPGAISPGLDQKKPVRPAKQPETTPEAAPAERPGDPPAAKKGWLARFFGDG